MLAKRISKSELISPCCNREAERHAGTPLPKCALCVYRNERGASLRLGRCAKQPLLNTMVMPSLHACLCRCIRLLPPCVQCPGTLCSCVDCHHLGVSSGRSRVYLASSCCQCKLVSFQRADLEARFQSPGGSTWSRARLGARFDRQGASVRCNKRAGRSSILLLAQLRKLLV